MPPLRDTSAMLAADAFESEGTEQSALSDGPRLSMSEAQATRQSSSYSVNVGLSLSLQTGLKDAQMTL